MSRGRPKNYNPYLEITYEELGDWVGKNAKIQVCKKWMTQLGYPIETDNKVIQDDEIDSNNQPKIEYTLTNL
jgi:hypothetical protein